MLKPELWHTPSIAFAAPSSKEGRKDVVNQCLEFGAFGHARTMKQTCIIILDQETHSTAIK